MADRNDKPRRFRNARSDASIGSVEKRIERDLGLPKGSVDIRRPDGRSKRNDASIASLKKDK